MPADIPEEQLAAMTALAKRQLRQRQRGLRQGLPRAAHGERCWRLVERLRELPELANPRGVALFWPIVERREIDLRPLDEALRERGVPIYYPFMRKKAEGGFVTGFSRVDDLAVLAPRGRGFDEPPADAPAASRGAIDVVVVPALALSAAGERLGYGAGYYDATIPDHRPPATVIGVVFDFQLLAELPTTPHDQTMDVVVTDERVVRGGA